MPVLSLKSQFRVTGKSSDLRKLARLDRPSPEMGTQPGVGKYGNECLNLSNCIVEKQLVYQ